MWRERKKGYEGEEIQESLKDGKLERMKDKEDKES